MLFNDWMNCCSSLFNIVNLINQTNLCDQPLRSWISANFVIFFKDEETLKFLNGVVCIIIYHSISNIFPCKWSLANHGR